MKKKRIVVFNAPCGKRANRMGDLFTTSEKVRQHIGKCGHRLCKIKNTEIKTKKDTAKKAGKKPKKKPGHIFVSAPLSENDESKLKYANDYLALTDARKTLLAVKRKDGRINTAIKKLTMQINDYAQ